MCVCVSVYLVDLRVLVCVCVYLAKWATKWLATKGGPTFHTSVYLNREHNFIKERKPKTSPNLKRYLTALFVCFFLGILYYLLYLIYTIYYIFYNLGILYYILDCSTQKPDSIDFYRFIDLVIIWNNQDMMYLDLQHTISIWFSRFFSKFYPVLPFLSIFCKPVQLKKNVTWSITGLIGCHLILPSFT